jgi:hypothetical protein
MTQIFNRLPDKCGLHILCSYKNITPTAQITRITNIPHWYFERVVFPRELMLFEALPEAVLEIYSTDEMRLSLSDCEASRRHRFLCDWLKVNRTNYVNT